MNQEQKLQAAEVLNNRVITKAQNDSEFLNRLIKAPEDALKNFLGEQYVPLKRSIVVEDQTDDSIIYFNIPAEPNLDDLELSQDQLELVAGGGTPFIIGYYAIVSNYGCAAVAVAAVGYAIGRFT